MPVTTLFAPSFKPYLSIDGIKIGHTYRYQAREDKLPNGERVPKFYPVVECRMHRTKHRLTPIVYIAVKAGADVCHLQPGEKLYVGSQTTADRMFRGDVPRGVLNFHHAQMRTGRNGANLQTYLEAGGKVDIYLAESDDLCGLVSTMPEHANLNRLLSGQVPFSHATHLKYKYHTGYWAEQLILRDELSQWAWNSEAPTKLAREAMRIANV